MARADNYENILQLKLYSMSNDTERTENKKFPGLFDENILQFYTLSEENKLNQLKVSALKNYLSAHYLSCAGRKQQLMDRIYQHMNVEQIEPPPRKRRRLQ
eukprot:397220_1